jgi:hypothetical protein
MLKLMKNNILPGTLVILPGEIDEHTVALFLHERTQDLSTQEDRLGESST